MLLLGAFDADLSLLIVAEVSHDPVDSFVRISRLHDKIVASLILHTLRQANLHVHLRWTNGSIRQHDILQDDSNVHLIVSKLFGKGATLDGDLERRLIVFYGRAGARRHTLHNGIGPVFEGPDEVGLDVGVSSWDYGLSTEDSHLFVDQLRDAVEGGCPVRVANTQDRVLDTLEYILALLLLQPGDKLLRIVGLDSVSKMRTIEVSRDVYSRAVLRTMQ